MKKRQRKDFDDLAAKALGEFSQRLSRRGLLAKVGKYLIGAAGLAVIPTLPVDRMSTARAVDPCSDWMLCGICGYVCNPTKSGCCNGQRNSSGCPSCLTRGSYAWSKCCTDVNDIACGGFLISYYDCCGAGGSNCRGATCLNNCEQPAWCSNGLAYGCTVAVVGASCVP